MTSNATSAPWRPLTFVDDYLDSRERRLLHSIEPLKDPPKPRRERDAFNRNADIRARHAAGESYTVLAEKYGVSRERIRQIVKEEHRPPARLRGHRARRSQPRSGGFGGIGAADPDRRADSTP